MRRMLVLGGAVLVVAAVAIVAITAGGSGAETTGPKVAARTEPPPATGPFAVAASQGESTPGPAEATAERHRAAGVASARGRERRRDRWALLRDRVTTDLAGRLGVSERNVGYAVGAVRASSLAHAVDTGMLSVEERLALEACLDRQGCDPAAGRQAARKLRRALTPDRLVQYKEAMLKRFAWELGTEAEDVEPPLRAELETVVLAGQRLGRLTERDRDTALRCFDRPADCDVDALWRIGRRR